MLQGLGEYFNYFNKINVDTQHTYVSPTCRYVFIDTYLFFIYTVVTWGGQNFTKSCWKASALLLVTHWDLNVNIMGIWRLHCGPCHYFLTNNAIIMSNEAIWDTCYYLKRLKLIKQNKDSGVCTCLISEASVSRPYCHIQTHKHTCSTLGPQVTLRSEIRPGLWWWL